MTILVAGDGPVGRALARAFADVGLEVDRWTRATVAPPRRADVALVAVTDRAIGEVAARLGDEGAVDGESVLLHCAGAVPAAEAFAAMRGRVRGVGLLHPLRAFAGAPIADDLAGTVFGVEGDPVGRATAIDLAQRIGGRPLALDGGGLARYHAAAALAGNHTLALVDAAIAILVGLGLTRCEATASLSGLLASAARNIAALGLPDALTGPIARGDVAAIRRHLAALGPEERSLYRHSARPTVRVARARGHADPEALIAIEALLADDGD